MTENNHKPYHRQDGEPNLWYDRFHKFMRMGPNRSTTRCYRQVINAERAAQGRSLLSDSASCPDVWRHRAAQFNWKERAETWDDERRQRDLQNIEQALSQARSLATQAVQILESAMLGKLRNPDGSLTEGQNCTQRRLAAECLLKLGGIPVLAADQEEYEQPINEIVIVDSQSPEGRQRQAEIRRQANQNYYKNHPFQEKDGGEESSADQGWMP